ncbi:MAG: FadR family transcriptional regulator [Alphaproteobacteria bacterium]|nr:FadR family transcriptional regulator [Alphaproteobacteria bacterium]
MPDAHANALAERLRLHYSEGGYGHSHRLPPERALCGRFGVSRTTLRKALAILEADGLIWRHVGRGTFLGARPIFDLDDVDYLAGLAQPPKVVEARMAMEPELARLAAIHGVKANFDEIAVCGRRCREARDWRVYEAWDERFHLAIAKATRNKMLLHLFETVNAVRRSVVWSRPRQSKSPPRTHASFDEHDAIAAAIAARDGERSAALMRAHLLSVRSRTEA